MEQEALTETIQRYQNWLLNGTWVLPYWKNEGHWRAEIKAKIKELKNKKD